MVEIELPKMIKEEYRRELLSAGFPEPEVEVILKVREIAVAHAVRRWIAAEET